MKAEMRVLVRMGMGAWPGRWERERKHRSERLVCHVCIASLSPRRLGGDLPMSAEMFDSYALPLAADTRLWDT